MRLTSATVTGFGRLTEGRINLDSKVIAVVGPNEAGKTTLLRALAFLTDGGTLPVAERSRSITVADDSTVVTAAFAITDDDLSSAEVAVAERPRELLLSRRAVGDTRYVSIRPHPRRPTNQLAGVPATLDGVLERHEELVSTLEPGGLYSAEAPSPRDFAADLRSLRDMVAEVLENRATASLTAAESIELVSGLSDATRSSESAEELRIGLHAISEWQSIPDPEPLLRSNLVRLAPSFLLFDEAERTIASAYAFDQNLANSPPAALRNIVEVAGVNLPDLFAAVQSGDVSRWLSTIRRGNAVLRKVFEQAWNQSNLTVELGVNGAVLQVLIAENSVDVTPFDERSAGLKMFVALTAFLLARHVDGDIVLLIDEAENHLHIDAQADLVEMLSTQTRASRVIYTTHSPACLPADLGRNVRAVLPATTDRQASRISNHFWTEEGAGFSPLLIAMGAGAAAFSSARRVVLGEGATEMMLLPTLLRDATGETSIPYQVAPGLAEAAPSFYSTLDLEGARVAYLVDGDDAGSKLRAKLFESGVQPARVVQMGAPTLENLLPEHNYQQAVKELLREKLGAESFGDLPDLRAGESWPATLSSWAKRQGISLPSKVAIANRLLESGSATVGVDRIEEVRDLHRRLLAALGA